MALIQIHTVRDLVYEKSNCNALESKPSTPLEDPAV